MGNILEVILPLTSTGGKYLLLHLPNRNVRLLWISELKHIILTAYRKYRILSIRKVGAQRRRELVGMNRELRQQGRGKDEKRL